MGNQPPVIPVHRRQVEMGQPDYRIRELWILRDPGNQSRKPADVSFVPTEANAQIKTCIYTRMCPHPAPHCPTKNKFYLL